MVVFGEALVDMFAEKPQLALEEADRFVRWWVPKSFGLSLDSCELDVREGGTYRLVFRHPDAPQPMAFHGRYREVVAPFRLAWTNDEAGGAGQLSTVTLEDAGGRTRIVLHDRYPTKEALDEAIASGSTSGLEESFDQLDALLASSSGAGRLARCSRASSACPTR